MADKDEPATVGSVPLAPVAQQGQQAARVLANARDRGVADHTGVVAKGHGARSREIPKQQLLQPHCLFSSGFLVRPCSVAVSVEAMDGHHAGGRMSGQRRFCGTVGGSSLLKVGCSVFLLPLRMGWRENEEAKVVAAVFCRRNIHLGSHRDLELAEIRGQNVEAEGNGT